ncbi:MAG: type III pantothenate kinase [candidate division WOR-3 bacterium]
MILTVLVGNTNTRLTWFARGRVLRRWIIPSERIATELCSMPNWHGCHVAVASVVPNLTVAVANLLEKSTGRQPFVVGPRTRTGLRFRYRRREIGADRVCLAVGAYERFCLPHRSNSYSLTHRRNCVVIDFGTATTVNVITGDGVYAGGLILPGVHMMMDSLKRGTAQLPSVPFALTRLPYGCSTAGAIRAGVAGLLTGGLRSIVADIAAVTGRQYYTVATGGAAVLLVRRLKIIKAYDPDIAAYGLLCLYRLNRLNGRFE